MRVQYLGGLPVHLRAILNTLRGISEVHWGILSTLKGYHDTVWDTLSAPGIAQCTGGRQSKIILF